MFRFIVVLAVLAAALAGAPNAKVGVKNFVPKYCVEVGVEVDCSNRVLVHKSLLFGCKHGHE